MPIELLVSIINTKLRDQYSSLNKLIDDLEIDSEDLFNKLKNSNYYYDENLNKIKSL